MGNKIGRALVVGAGISGIRSALDLAESGYRVTLIDKAPNPGGTLMQLDYQFPSDHCGMCKMLPLIERDSSSQFCLRKGLFHENIDIMLSTELVGLDGEPGNFKAVVRTKPSLVDSKRCMGCGECSRVCPVEVPDAFNARLGTRKAVYLPVPHSIPNHYVVDTAACSRCGECEKACPTGAIDLRLNARRAFRILVVDDELIVRDSTKEWLDDEGFQTDMAESGVEALEKLAAKPFNLMLLDVKMPGMDGVEVLKRAREIYPELPVIMMTAYATVETAVEAMKVGALDYLMKPFDPDVMMGMVGKLYRDFEPAGEEQLEVGAVILAAGFESFDAASLKDTYGYGEYKDVVTGVEFERLASKSGPTQGRLLRPSDGKEVRKVAWIQCVGSRNLQANADYCSSICCMFSIKEALLAKKRSGGTADTAIFYMDMRTFGKGFQRYRESAEDEQGVRFVRSRVHSVEKEPDGALRIYSVDLDGTVKDELFDLVVLATGQKAPAAAAELAESAAVELNSWGFCRAGEFSLSRTSREGILVSGSFSGLKDISESLIQASSASLLASSMIHSKGGGLSEVVSEDAAYRDVSRELPGIAVVVCSCAGALEKAADLPVLAAKLEGLDCVARVITTDKLCTQEGWLELEETLKNSRSNRVLLGACQPCIYGKKLKELGKSVGLNPVLMDVVDIRTSAFSITGEDQSRVGRNVLSALSMGVARLRGADPVSFPSMEITAKALVVGGGIAGMTAALAIADHGFEVHLVEKAAELGGNLRMIHRTLEGHAPKDLLQKTLSRVEKHPLIHIYRNANPIACNGQVGHFLTTIQTDDGSLRALDHGVTILATGGVEAGTASYGYGQTDAILTQHELEERLHSAMLNPSDLMSVVMIQCVDSRDNERQYCSRICCASALKNALYLKEQNPQTDIYILYRDVMAYGFLESYYTKARQAGIIFIQYNLNDKPKVAVEEGRTVVSVKDPILGREIIFRPDLLALGTGIVPSASRKIADIFGVELNGDGFFQEAESKWRPVDFMKAGVFMCGIAHSPRFINESIATAEAAAQRGLGIIGRGKLTPGSILAGVRHSLCSLCERCIEVCPYGARWKDEEEERIMVNDLICQGCGSCAAACPNSASVLKGYSDQQMFAVMDAALEMEI